MKREQKQQIINIAIQEYIDTPEKQRSLTKLGEKYGVKRQTLSKYLKERGIEIINYQNRCRIKEDVFNIINTEEKAYWLGFIFADGNISSTGNRFEINLSIKDIDHMIKLKNFLKYEEDIRVETHKEFKTEICRMSVRNKNLWNALNDKGCTPRKSLTLIFPENSIFFTQDLVYPFIRGYFDGDGSLGIYPKKNSVCENLNLVGTESFLKSIETILGVKGHIRNKSTNNYVNNSYSLQYSSKKARKVAKLLYENANIYLNRKYNIYIQFCQRDKELSMKKLSKNGESWDANTVLSN